MTEPPDSAAAPGFPQRFGDYELLGEIARGGMGIVYRARQIRLNRIVALKMILAGPFASRHQSDRFRTEAESAAILQHPHIVRIYETGEHEGRPFFSMDYVPGGDLATLVRDGLPPTRSAARLLKTLAEAIEYAHQHGILHRDLKPSNVLLDRSGQPRLTDFGLAGSLQQEGYLTVTGEVLGSPCFMPPEQAQGRRGRTGRPSDVYGLGAILFFLLTGRPPFLAESVTDTLAQVIGSDAISPRLIRPDVPVDLATICQKCLEKDPGRRYPTARELAEELGRFLADEPIRARPVSRPEIVWRWARRNRGVSGLLAATGLLVLVVAIGSPIAAWRVRDARLILSTNLYAADMKLAHLSISSGNLGRARAILDTHRSNAVPDPRGFEWGLYQRLARGTHSLAFRAHESAVTGIAFLPGGRLVVTSDQGDCVRLWNFPDFTLSHELHSTNWGLGALSVSADGRYFAAPTVASGAVLGDLDNRRMAGTVPGGWGRAVFAPSGHVVALIEGDLIGGERRGRVLFWDLAAQREITSWPNAGSRVCWSPDGRTVFVGAWDGNITAREYPGGRILQTFEDRGNLMTLAVSPDGQTLVTAHIAGDLRLWETSSGKRLADLRGPALKTWALAFSLDGRLLATASSDRTLRLWDPRTGQSKATLMGHGEEIWSVALSPDGRRAVSGDKRGNVMLWNLDDLAETQARERPDGIVGQPKWSPDGRTLAFGIGHHQVALLDVASERIRSRIHGAELALAFSRGGSTLDVLTTNGVGRVRLSASSENIVQPVHSLSPLPNPVKASGVSPDGRWFASEREPRTLFIWDLAEGRLHRKFDLGPDGLDAMCFAFAPDGGSLAVTKYDATNVFVLTDRLSRTLQLQGHRMTPWWATFSPDSRTIATASMDDQAGLWETSSGRLLAFLPDHREGASGIEFSPDGRTLAVVSGSRWMKLWNIPTLREMGEFDTTELMSSVGFSPNSDSLVAWNHYRGQFGIRFWHADPLVSPGATPSSP